MKIQKFDLEKCPKCGEWASSLGIDTHDDTTAHEELECPACGWRGFATFVLFERFTYRDMRNGDHTHEHECRWPMSEYTTGH